MGRRIFSCRLLAVSCTPINSTLAMIRAYQTISNAGASLQEPAPYIVEDYVEFPLLFGSYLSYKYTGQNSTQRRNRSYPDYATHLKRLTEATVLCYSFEETTLPQTTLGTSSRFAAYLKIYFKIIKDYGSLFAFAAAGSSVMTAREVLGELVSTCLLGVCRMD